MVPENRPSVRESELLNNIMNSSIDGIICIDTEYRYFLYNDSMARISGIPGAQVLGKIAYEAFPFLKETSAFDSYRRAMGGEIVQDLGCRFDVPESGKHGFFDSTYTPIRNESGAVVGVMSVVHEVTELVMAQRARAESEEKYQSLTRYAHDAFISCDIDGQILSWNQGAKELFGYIEEEIVGKSISLIIPAGFWKNYVEEIRKSQVADIPSKQRRSSELFGNHKLGSSLPIDISLSAWSAGGKIFFSALVRDITTPKHFEALAEDRQKIYEALLQTQGEMGMGMSIVREDSSRFFYVSKDLCDLYGYSPEEFMRMEDLSVLSAPEMREFFVKRVQKRAKQPWDSDRYESISIKKDGTRFFVEISLTRCETNFGLSIVVLTRDITKAKVGELELIEQRRINNQIMEHAQDVILTFTIDGTILTMSASFEAVTGWKREEWYGRNIADTVVPEDLTSVAQASERVLDGHSAGARVIRSRKKNGDVFYAETMRSPIFREGKVVGMIGIARDVTARIKHEEDLRTNELKFRTLADATIEAVAITSNGIILGTNQSFWKMFGYSQEEVVGMNTDAFADMEQGIARRKLVETDPDAPSKMLLKRKDGNTFYGEVRGKFIQYKGSQSRVIMIKELES